MKKVNEENKYFIGKCVDFTHDGQGVVRINNKTIQFLINAFMIYQHYL